MMVILPAAVLALSVHVLPAIAFAFPSPQSSTDQCINTSACTTVVNALTDCGVGASTTSFTTAQEKCLCSYNNFVSSTATCFACMGQDASGIESACAAYNGGSVSSASATKSASATASRTQTRTASAATSTTTVSSDDCLKTDACVSVARTLNDCNVTASDLSGSLTDADMTCMCSSKSFEADIANCLACSGESTAGADTICDAYAASSSSRETATRTTASVSRATSTGSSGGSGTTTGAGSSATSAAGTGNGLSGGLVTNQNGAGSLGVPGLVVPALVMAAAAWRVVF